LLAQQPGLSASSNGGLGKNSSIYVRGLDARHVLLLVDGVRTGSATTGSANFDNLPLGEIERIEIVRGPLASLYGSDAVGGVIQIFTRRAAEGVRLQANASAGSNRYAQFGGGVRFGEGPWTGAAHGQHTETRGFSATNPRAQFGSFNADRDGFRQDSATLRLGYRFNADWTAEARALHADGLTHYDDGASADSLARLRTEVLGVDLRGVLTPGWRSSLRVSRSTDEYDTLASANAFTTPGEIGTVQRQLSWENTLATPVGSVLLVAEHLRQNVAKPGAPYPVNSRSVNALALGLDGAAGPHSWQTSVRHDRNSQYGGQTTGALGYALDLATEWRASASLGTSFVAPSFNQLYWPGFGNAALEPEEGRHAELGLRWSTGMHSLRASWFDNRIRGYITPGANPGNVDARVDGTTIAYEGRVEALRVAASVDRLDPRNASADHANYGKQLPRRAKTAARLALDATFGSFDVGAFASAFSGRYDNAANTLRLAGYGTLDLRADWRFAPEWTLGAKLNNVADKAYETAYGFNQPGREFYVTLRYVGR
jgi:vitamin B12 transporter